MEGEDWKSEHKLEVVDSDKGKSNDEMDIPESSTGKKEIPKQETPSTTDAKTERLLHPLESNNPQHEEIDIGPAHRKRRASPPTDTTQPKKLKTSPAPFEINILSGHRKRHASPSDDTSPKKLAPTLSEENVVRGHRKRCAPTLEVTESKKLALPVVRAPAEKDSSDAEESLQCQFESLHIDQSGKGAMLQGVIFRPLSEILVYREQSGYVNAQADFYVRPDVSGGSVKGVPGSSREGVPGSSREGVPGSSREGVPGGIRENVPGGIREGVPIITIYAPEESYAKIKFRYNDVIPYVEEKLAKMRPIIEAIPVFLKAVERARKVCTPFQYSRTMVEKYVIKLEFICKCLEKLIPEIENEVKDCIRGAGILNWIYSVNETKRKPTNLTRRNLWQELDGAVECVDSLLITSWKQATEYKALRDIIEDELSMGNA